MSAEVEIVVGAEGDHGEVRVDEVDDLQELQDVVAEALGKVSERLVLDLRCAGRPPVPLLAALDVAVTRSALARVPLRCLVASEEMAERLRRSVRSGAATRSEWRTGGLVVELLTGDIVSTAADAVVNASNVRLVLGAGVSGALKRACGPGLQAEMSAHAPIEPGDLAVTGSHGLSPVSRILHVATASGGGPVVKKALANVLHSCEALAIETVAIPALGAGTGALPIDACASIFADVLADHGAGAAHPKLVRVVLWSDADHAAFVAALRDDPRFTP